MADPYFWPLETFLFPPDILLPFRHMKVWQDGFLSIVFYNDLHQTKVMAIRLDTSRRTLEVFPELKRFNLVENQCEFSTQWLNKSRRYYSMIRSSDHEPSVDALGRLAANLKQKHDTCKQSKFGELRLKAEWIYPLTTKVWTAFYKKALERHFI